jgi:hypothetical protein
MKVEVVDQVPFDVQRVPPKQCCLSLMHFFFWPSIGDPDCQNDVRSKLESLEYPCDRFIKLTANSTAIRPFPKIGTDDDERENIVKRVPDIFYSLGDGFS